MAVPAKLVSTIQSRLFISTLVVIQLILVLFYLPGMLAGNSGAAAAAAAAAWAHTKADQLRVPNPFGPASLETLLQALYRDFKVAVDAPRFVTHDGDAYTLPADVPPLYTQPLGRRILILDMDGRPFAGENEAWSENDVEFAKMAGTSAGFYNHYTYALVHGYSYKFIRTAKPSWGAPVWAEIPAIKSVLADYDFVVSLDSDTLFPNLNLPFEWLLNRWNVTHDVAFAMANDRRKHPDPTAPTHYDSKGNLRDNPGFLTVQNVPVAFEMLDRWLECPFKVDGCDAFKTRFPAEMGAWSEYVRYEAGGRYWDVLRELPCAEANGFPEQTSECNGVFLRHFTSDKKRLRPAVGNFMAHSFFHILHDDMVARRAELVREDSVFGEGTDIDPAWQ